MKGLLRSIVVNFLTLFLLAKFSAAIYFSDNFLVLFWAAFVLTVLNLLVKPILNILLTPINFITLGAFRWIINLIMLFLVTLFIPEFKIISFTFNGYSVGGFVIPAFRFSFFWALFLVSFLIELVSGVIDWLFK